MSVPTLQDVKNTLLTIQSNVSAVIKPLWDKYGIFFIVFGVLLLVAKGANLIIDFLSWRSKQELDSAKKQDASLSAEETKYNNQANQLIDKANSLPSQEKPVDENWDRKK